MLIFSSFHIRAKTSKRGSPSCICDGSAATAVRTIRRSFDFPVPRCGISPPVCRHRDGSLRLKATCLRIQFPQRGSYKVQQHVATLFFSGRLDDLEWFDLGLTKSVETDDDDFDKAGRQNPVEHGRRTPAAGSAPRIGQPCFGTRRRPVFASALHTRLPAGASR